MRTECIERFNEVGSGLRDHMLAEADELIAYHEQRIVDLRAFKADLRAVTDRVLPPPALRTSDGDETGRIAAMLAPGSRGDRDEPQPSDTNGDEA